MMHNTVIPDWIAVDWGTSNLRVWGLQENGDICQKYISSKGMAALHPDQFESTLVKIIKPWIKNQTITVIACGMVGARQGWFEACYTPVPCKIQPDYFVTPPTINTYLNVYIIPGLCQNNPSDVMRGEETQIGGFLAMHHDWQGTICLPGTHTKWVHVNDGTITRFQTFMTGELFALLSQYSVLRYDFEHNSWDKTAFLNAVAATHHRPETTAARLFSIRAKGLLTTRSAAIARAQLSGYLIGQELAASRSFYHRQNLAIIGTTKLAKSYAAALQMLDISLTLYNTESMTIAGLTCAYQKWKESQ